LRVVKYVDTNSVTDIVVQVALMLLVIELVNVEYVPHYWMKKI